MSFESIIEIEDKSFYTDRLEKMTGMPRRMWGRLPLEKLQVIYQRRLRKSKERNRYEKSEFEV